MAQINIKSLLFVKIEVKIIFRIPIQEYVGGDY